MTLRNRLMLALVATNLGLVVLVLLISGVQFERNFLGYLERADAARLAPVVEVLERWFAEQGDWAGLEQNLAAWQTLLGAQRRGGRGHEPMAGMAPRRGLDQRLLLRDSTGRLLIGRPRLLSEAHWTPVRGPDGQVVAELGVVTRPELLDGLERAFSEQQRKVLIVSGVLAVALAAGLSWLLATWLTAPLRRGMRAVESLAAGNYDNRIDDGRGDEIGDLLRDIDALAHTLSESRQAQQRFFSDIAHELRTPVAVLRGELEALQDGVRAVTPEALQSLHQEIMQLQRLVDDLRTLAAADEGSLEYTRRPLELAGWLRGWLQRAESGLSARGLNLEADIAEDDFVVEADEQRLQQLMENLLQNSLAYTRAPGRVRVSLGREGDRLLLRWADSAPGVSDEALPRLFDRLYRADASRSRALGGSGLGLSICARIAEAHGASLRAEHATEGGIAVLLSWPLTGER